MILTRCPPLAGIEGRSDPLIIETTMSKQSKNANKAKVAKVFSAKRKAKRKAKRSAKALKQSSKAQS
mgnify:CR=1 FL=1